MKIYRLCNNRIKLWVSLAFVVFVAGCTTPNLKPFADATSTMSSAGRKAGDLTLSQLAGKTIKTGQGTFRPGDANHPSVQFENSWNLRRKTIDDIEAYAAALAALGDASSNSKSNVTQVLGSLKELAGNVPTFGPAFNAAGDLIVTIGQTVIEIKAYHDMAKLVQAAQPLVNDVVDALNKDFAGLQILYESQSRAELKRLKDDAEAPRKYYDSLCDSRNSLRDIGGAIVDDSSKRDKILQLDLLIAGVEPQIKEFDKQIAAQKQAMEDGLLFFKQAKQTLLAWQQTHDQLYNALSEHQIPNLTLLVARAQELKAAADNLRKPQTP